MGRPKEESGSVEEVRKNPVLAKERKYINVRKIYQLNHRYIGTVATS